MAKINLPQTANLNTNKYSGVWTAIGTPFTKNLDIDWQALEKILAVQINGDVDGIVVAGTTGESPTLSTTEKSELVKFVRDTVPETIHVMAGSGTSSTTSTIELSKALLDSGADSLLIVTPPYNKPNPTGLRAHYSSVAKETAAEICVYHVPGRTGQFLSVDQLSSLAQIDGVKAIKEASGDIGFFSRLAAACPNIALLSGDDPTYLGSLASGGKGVISVISNVFPTAFKTITTLATQGERNVSWAMFQAVLPAIDVLFCESNPAPLKAAWHHLGWAENTLRLPLGQVSDPNYQRIANTIDLATGRLNEVTP